MIATTGDNSPLYTQNRVTVRNSTLLSGSYTSVVNVKNTNSVLTVQLYLEDCDIDGWFQDWFANADNMTDGLGTQLIGINVQGVTGPAVLKIGRNVRILNVGVQAIQVTGTAQVFTADDFVAGQPQIDRVIYRSSSPQTVNQALVPSLGIPPQPTALIACPNSVVAGEFQAPATAPMNNSGSALAIGASNSLADYTRLRVRLTFIPDMIYALTISNANQVVVEYASGVQINMMANGIKLLSAVMNLNLNSVHFESIGGTLISPKNGSFFTNSGDLWGLPGLSGFSPTPTAFFVALVKAAQSQ